MKRSEAARYARWSAGAALLLAGLTGGVYLQHKWVEYREKRNAPAPAPKDVTRLSSGLTFSKMDGDRKIFTVEASKATDFKDKEASLLEDVKITIFGKTGTRHDTVHTKSCQYEKMSGSIACSGDVQMDLESAADAERAARNPAPAAGQKVHVETREVTFNRVSGTAHSNQLVKFSFPSGTGDAVGVEYDSEEGKVRLLRDVHMSLVPPKSEAAGKKATKTGPQDPVHVTAKSLDFARDSRRMRLQGPVTAETSQARLVAGELTLAVNSGFHAEKLIATAGAVEKRPELAIQQADGPANLSAETLIAYFAPEGWLTKMEGAGNVQGSRRSGKAQDEFKAENASVTLWPKGSQPKKLNLNGNVWVKTLAENTGSVRLLQTSALLVEFAGGAQGQTSRPRRAETLGAGSIEWTDAVPPSGAPRAAASHAAVITKLQADKLGMEFEAEGRARQMVATGNVRTERAAVDAPLQTATAQNGVAQLLATGGWSQMDLQGNVKLKEGSRSGQADHAVFVHATQSATLTGNALARDGATETRATKITFSQATGEIRAEGGVHSTQFSSKGGAIQLAAAPANISSDTLQANSKTGRALYTRHARLWQGDSVLEADSIDLLRDAKVLNATGNVRAVFPQYAAPPGGQTLAVQAARKKTLLWHVAAETLTYSDVQNRAHLEKNVVVQSAEQKIHAAAMDLYFTGGGSANSSAGAKQISRAIGAGGVIVEQGERKATAERGEYTAAEGKFVMSGGNPTIYDASKGTTTGRQLTFFLADDTIIVDSENGSRTLTKHRVEK
jgi:lipopolysaccharide export system protein LptA